MKRWAVLLAMASCKRALFPEHVVEKGTVDLTGAVPEVRFDACPDVTMSITKCLASRANGDRVDVELEVRAKPFNDEVHVVPVRVGSCVVGPDGWQGISIGARKCWWSR
jgi:hypothetical protein